MTEWEEAMALVDRRFKRVLVILCRIFITIICITLSYITLISSRPEPAREGMAWYDDSKGEFLVFTTDPNADWIILDDTADITFGADAGHTELIEIYSTAPAVEIICTGTADFIITGD
jgi:hypothetical protein